MVRELKKENPLQTRGGRHEVGDEGQGKRDGSQEMRDKRREIDDWRQEMLDDRWVTREGRQKMRKRCQMIDG